MNILSKIEHALRSDHLVEKGDKVLIAVSGGPDSVALLKCLYDLKDRLGLRLSAAHINHRLRSSADTDERFVKNLCTKLNVPLTVVRLKPFKKHNSLEDQSREARYKALLKIAQKIKADVIAVGHHRDDLAETVLMRILRGTGLQGLQAILPKRDLYGQTIVRPLLSLTRLEIERFLKENKIPSRQDPTNAKTYFFRNKVRHQLLPYIEKNYQPNIREILANLAFTSSQDYEFLRQKSGAVFSSLGSSSKKGEITLKTAKLKTLPLSLRRMCLRQGFERASDSTHSLSLQHLGEIEDLLLNRPEKSVVDLAQVSVKKIKNHLIFSKKKTT